jgi:hypothetical protein
MSAQDAVALIESGMTLEMSGFTGSGIQRQCRWRSSSRSKPRTVPAIPRMMQRSIAE